MNDGFYAKEQDLLARCARIVEELYPGCCVTVIVVDDEQNVMVTNDLDAQGTIEETLDAMEADEGEHYVQTSTLQ